ncbi:MAG: glycosyltransferase [Candidatus Aminicenantales bacterium]
MNSLHVLILLLLLLLGANLRKNIRNMQLPETPGFEGDPALVSVLIPARNEEDKIKRCVRSLLKSNYPKTEILVLDDNSRDRTFALVQSLARHHRNLRVVRGKKLPPGWNGKNWACHQLAQQARGEWFLFTDADTEHSRDSISVALATALKNDAQFVSAIPGLITKTWAEKLILPVIHFAFLVLLPYNLINYFKISRVPVGIGPFLFIHRNAYAKCGGFEAIKSEILDDMALARRVRKSDGRISVMDGTDLVRVRFYTCFQEVWSGFSKNAFQAIGSSPYLLFVLSVGCYFLFIYPYLCLGACVLYGQNIVLPALHVLLISLMRIALSARFRTSYAYGLLHPLCVFLTLLILFNSFRLTLFHRKIEWKERLYPIE